MAAIDDIAANGTLPVLPPRPEATGKSLTEIITDIETTAAMFVDGRATMLGPTVGHLLNRIARDLRSIGKEG